MIDAYFITVSRGYFDDGTDAVVVDPEGEKKKRQLFVVPNAAERAMQLLQAFGDHAQRNRRPAAAYGLRHRAKQRQSKNNPPHRHAGKARAQRKLPVRHPKPIRPEEPENIDDQKQPSAQIPQRITARGNTVDLIDPQRKLSLEDVIALKHSYRMLLADRVKDDLVAAVRASSPDAATSQAIDVIAKWDNTTAPTSRGGVLFETWWRRYTEGQSPDSMYAEPWTVERPDELVRVTTPARYGGLGEGSDNFTNPLWEALRDRQDVFSGVFATADERFDLAGAASRARLRASG